MLSLFLACVLNITFNTSSHSEWLLEWLSSRAYRALKIVNTVQTLLLSRASHPAPFHGHLVWLGKPNKVNCDRPELNCQFKIQAKRVEITVISSSHSFWIFMFFLGNFYLFRINLLISQNLYICYSSGGLSEGHQLWGTQGTLLPEQWPQGSLMELFWGLGFLSYYCDCVCLVRPCI